MDLQVCEVCHLSNRKAQKNNDNSNTVELRIVWIGNENSTYTNDRNNEIVRIGHKNCNYTYNYYPGSGDNSHKST